MLAMKLKTHVRARSAPFLIKALLGYHLDGHGGQLCVAQQQRLQIMPHRYLAAADCREEHRTQSEQLTWFTVTPGLQRIEGRDRV